MTNLAKKDSRKGRTGSADRLADSLHADRLALGTSEQDREELVFAFIGAIGTELKTAEEALTRLLRSYDYHAHVVRISSIIREVPEYSAIDQSKPEYHARMIEGGNFICKTFGSKAILAEMAAEKIFVERPRTPIEKRRAFIIHSLKRPDEVKMLREIYGDAFYAIAVYAAEGVREARLIPKMGYGRHQDQEARSAAQRLIRLDERENAEWGQKVSDTFGHADYFVRTDDETDLEKSLQRLLDLVFGRPYLSPTASEVAMSQAHTAGLRSADMSRQIGAAVATRDRRVVATGCNDVPKPGGGQYWVDDREDHRDYKQGRDVNDEKKREAIIEMLEALDGVIFPEQYLDGGARALFDRLQAAGAFDGTRVDSLIEFGRVAHAEMAALNNAMLGQQSTRDCDVYTTTFPCHMCTRLIILAGIRNVFYIEPYPKSAAIDMYEGTEIRVNPALSSLEHDKRLGTEACEDKKTYFLPFEGVAPRRYHELFSNRKQKKGDGTVLDFDRQKAKPRRTPSLVAKHLNAEAYVAERVQPKLSKLRRKATDDDVPTETTP